MCVEAVALESILKVCQPGDVSGIDEREFWHNAAACPWTDEMPPRRYRDLFGRKEALARFAEMDAIDALAVHKHAVSKKNFRIAYVYAIEFALDKFPSEIQTIKASSIVTEPVSEPDTLGQYAAQALDFLQAALVGRCGNPQCVVVYLKDRDGEFASKCVDEAVKKHEEIVGPCTKSEMIKQALIQVRNLIERYHGRIKHLSCLQAKQQNVRTLMRLRAEAKSWSKEEEIEYCDRLLLRIPDALVQRFLYTRLSGRSIGIDADDRNLAGLIAAEKALLALE